jgi:hypothetical protein
MQKNRFTPWIGARKGGYEMDWIRRGETERTWRRMDGGGRHDGRPRRAVRARAEAARGHGDRRPAVHRSAGRSTSPPRSRRSASSCLSLPRASRLCVRAVRYGACVCKTTPRREVLWGEAQTVGNDGAGSRFSNSAVSHLGAVADSGPSSVLEDIVKRFSQIFE